MSRAMKDSGIPWIGEVPINWNVIRTKNVFDCSKEIIGQDWEHTPLLSLTTKGIKVVEIGRTSGKVPDSYETYQKVSVGEIVMCLFDLDCSAVFSGLSTTNGMISPAYKVLNVINGHNPQFYGYWFDYIFDGRKYKFLSKNIRYSLTYDEFAALGIVSPPIEEQSRIVAFLDRKCGEIDEAIALQEEFIEELKAYKHSVITEAVTRGLNPNVKLKDSGIDWIGKIPEHWSVGKIGKLFSVKAGGDASIEDYSAEQNEEFCYPVYTNTLNKDDVYAYTRKYKYCGETITVTGRGAIGHAFYRNNAYDAIIRLLVLSPKAKYDCRYYAYFIDNVVVFFTNSAAIGQLSASQILPYDVCVPLISEQKQIADYLDEKCNEIDSLIAIKQQKIEELKDYKKSIIYEYVTGKKEI